MFEFATTLKTPSYAEPESHRMNGCGPNELRFNCGGLPKPPPSNPITRYSAAAEAPRPPAAANAG